MKKKYFIIYKKETIIAIVESEKVAEDFCSLDLDEEYYYIERRCE